MKENTKWKQNTKSYSRDENTIKDDRKPKVGEAFILHDEAIPTDRNKKKKHRRHYHRGRKAVIGDRKEKDSSKLLINLSDHILTPAQRRVLSLGLKFVSTPTKINTTEHVTYCKRFARRMRLQEFFYGKNSDCEIFDSQDILNPKFRSRGLEKESDFTPGTNRDSH